MQAEDRLAEAMTVVRRTGGIPAPHLGWWALLRTFAGKDGVQARAEVLAYAAATRPVVRAFVTYAEAVEAGRAGESARAAELFASAEPEVVHPPFFHHVARRVLAQAALDDGWGEPGVWLVDAVAFFEAEGIDAPARSCRSLLALAGEPAPRRRHAPDGLSADLAAIGVTPRELDVLHLLAAGSTTKAIAEQLYLSPKTVERHIANLAGKVGVPARSQLVAFAATWAARQS